MADDLLLFSLPCFCRGAAPIGAVVIRKVTEASALRGGGRARIIRAGRGSGRSSDREGGTKLERIALVAEIVETALSRHLPAGSLIRLPPFSWRADGTGRAFEPAL